MGFLTDTEIEYRFVELNRHRFRVNPSFDVILDIQRLYQEELLSDHEKLDQALKMLVINRWKLRRLSINEKVRLLNEIYDRFVKTKRKGPMRGGPPTLDFELDGEYIYASFRQDYGIDLLEQRGRLSWLQFLALFQGLRDDTKIKQVIRIRTMEVPVPSRHNQRQIQNIMELKSFYALPVKGQGGREGFSALWSTLERMAVKDDGSE